MILHTIRSYGCNDRLEWAASSRQRDQQLKAIVISRVLDPGLLRKGREDAKDEPGAADFYYGEMEMRRHARGSASNRRRASSRGRVERGILTAYWLVSGYGLRAWRALAWLPS